MLGPLTDGSDVSVWAVCAAGQECQGSGVGPAHATRQRAAGLGVWPGQFGSWGMHRLGAAGASPACFRTGRLSLTLTSASLDGFRAWLGLRGAGAWELESSSLLARAWFLYRIASHQTLSLPLRARQQSNTLPRPRLIGEVAHLSFVADRKSAYFPSYLPRNKPRRAPNPHTPTHAVCRSAIAGSCRTPSPPWSCVPLLRVGASSECAQAAQIAAAPHPHPSILSRRVALPALSCFAAAAIPGPPSLT